MDRRGFLAQVGAGCAALGAGLPAARGAARRPNVLLIVCDDLNDYVNGFHGHPQARTPQVERLAASGVCFNRAYSNNPICAPSRSSFLTGVYPHTSRNHMFAPWYENPTLQNTRTVMEQFKLHGYRVIGSGKLMHHERPEEWSEFEHAADYGPFWYRDGERVAHPGVPEPYRSIGPVDGSFGALEDVPPPAERAPGEGWVSGVWGQVLPLEFRGPDDRDPTPDERNAAWAATRLAELDQSGEDQPFFLGVGFIRPHTPLHVPRRFFDLFPLDEVELPVLKEGDKDDTGLHRVAGEHAKGPLYFRLLKESYGGTMEGLRAFTRAYLASVAAVDDCIGQVIDALDRSRFRDDTIVVVTSDHGWNMGQKDWVFKMSLWEESCRVPLIIRAPGVAPAGQRAEHPVSLIDLYPTLVDLCGLPAETRKNERGVALEGHSLRPFLEDPAHGQWDGPDAVLSMIYSGADYDRIAEMQHYSVRTLDFRYVRYNNGFEELYDHRDDPYEWTNVAARPEYEATRQELRRKLDTMTGLRIGALPPPEPTRLDREGRVAYDFEEFNVGWVTATWPAQNRTVVTHDPARVISGRASLQLHGPGNRWNTVIFRELQVPPGMTCRIRFDARAVEAPEGSFLYYLLQQGRLKSDLLQVPLKSGEQTAVDGILTNDQDVTLCLTLGFTDGGTWIIDNLEITRQ